jgi:hypothetical protein
MFWNIKGFPVKNWHKKTRELNNWMIKYRINTMLMAEINTFWARLPADHQWSKQNAGQLQQNKKTSLAYNRKDKEVRGQQQFGGVAVTSVGTCMHRNLTTGEDPSGLARWAWHRYQGKDGIALRVVSAYRPNGPGTGGGYIVFAQHICHLSDNNNFRDPRSTFIEDLETQLQSWIEQGDQIVVGIDANDDLRNGPVNEMFERIGMHDSICAKYTNWDTAATCDSSQPSRPIDGIYTTIGLDILQGGYCPFHAGPSSQHCALWIDIPFSQAFGFIPPAEAPPTPTPKRKRSTRTQRRYNKQVKTELL